MKIATRSLALLTVLFTFTACDLENKNEDPLISDAPTAAEFSALRAEALESITQSFTLTANGGTAVFTSAQGVVVKIYTNCLQKNGVAVTGDFTVKFIEIFKRGEMVMANKTTMALDQNGVKSLLKSGGEFYVQALQDNVILDGCEFKLEVPVNLSNGVDSAMTGFSGTVQADGDVLWAPSQLEFWVGPNQDIYNALVADFGWFNCDRFYNYPGQRTSVDVIVPAGFNDTNSRAYIAINGEQNTLGNLGAQYPVGLDCHIIFVTEIDGMWRYASKSGVLSTNAEFTFATSDFETGTKEELVAHINALP